MKGKTILLASAAAMMVAMTAAPATAGEWWESTKISGRMYYDFSNLDAKTHTWNGTQYVATDSSNNGTNFDIKRFYVSIDHQFNDIFSADVTTDIKYLSGVGDTLYVKKAYLQAKLDPAFVVRLGATDMPWIPFVEGVYGYRYVENTLVDRDGYGTSSDWGIHVLGKLADGLISYQVSAVNGAGYRNTYRTKGIDVEGRVNIDYHGFIAAVGGYTGDLGAKHGTPTYHTASRFDALVGYKGHGIHAGFEYFNSTDWKTVTSSSFTDDSTGYSVFASYQFTPEWSAFGRYDWTDMTLTPTGFAGTKTTDNYYNLGVAFTPYKMVDFALVYKHAKDETKIVHGTFSDSDEVGIWGRLRW